ncbi:MAG: ATP-binding protein [Thiogranum sp.]|nr:ATP-binding protein [Thiogranum sp.]
MLYRKLAEMDTGWRSGSTGHSDVPMRGLRFFLTRAVWLLSGAALMLLVFSLALFIYSSWRYADRIDAVQQQLRYLVDIENAEGSVRMQLVNLLESPTGYLATEDLDPLREQLRTLRASGGHLMASTPAALSHALDQLAEFEGSSRYPLNQALYAVRDALNQELFAHQAMVTAYQREAQRSWHIAVSLAIGLLVISGLLWAMIRQRILEPLNKLADQMTLLARHDYTELPVVDADPMLYPMITNYNRTTQRLRELEQIQQERQATLTEEVRDATYMLMQQQRRLAQAERLGAVGEVAAGVAHELRNPLTTVQMALENLRRDVADPEVAERLAMVADEVRRVTRQLNQLLDQARQRPEKRVTLDVAEELDNLVSLALYQLRENISVHFTSHEELFCSLPRSRLRQALLNLILNAGQSLGDTGGDIFLAAQRQDNHLEIGVADSGPGFPPEMLEAGVQAFCSLRPGGTGLGLVMVRRFVTDLGGELLLSNRDEGGACVRLRLPCNGSDG